MPPPNGGCIRHSVDITTSQAHAANFSHPSRDVNACLLAQLNVTTLIDETEKLPCARCCLSAFPRPDGQIARSGRPPNHKAGPPCARRLPTEAAGPRCGREIAARRLELGAVARQ